MEKRIRRFALHPIEKAVNLELGGIFCKGWVSVWCFRVGCFYRPVGRDQPFHIKGAKRLKIVSCAIYGLGAHFDRRRRT